MGLIGSIAGKVLKGAGTLLKKGATRIKENKANRQAISDLEQNILPRENPTAQQGVAIGIKQIPIVVWAGIAGLILWLILKKK